MTVIRPAELVPFVALIGRYHRQMTSQLEVGEYDGAATTCASIAVAIETLGMLITNVEGAEVIDWMRLERLGEDEPNLDELKDAMIALFNVNPAALGILDTSIYQVQSRR